MNFTDKLVAAANANQSQLCVGLDPYPARFPVHLHSKADAVVQFCKAIIDVTADIACAFKPQIACFSALRAEEELEEICHYLRTNYPALPIVLDAKRGDIGSTATQYAREAFERYGADAVTVNPYMGFDSIKPYLEWEDRGTIILCRTSNPGSADLQSLLVGDKPLYLHVAQRVAHSWNTNGQCGLVVGATFPDELAQVRAIVGDMPLLIPGIGAQGGDIAATVKAGRAANGGGMLINSSRAILYALPDEEKGEDFTQAARRVALETRDTINLYRKT